MPLSVIDLGWEVESLTDMPAVETEAQRPVALRVGTIASM
jgi:hypothetical protein